MANVKELFDRIGGNAEISRLTGLKKSTVSEMKRRNSVPPLNWPKLIKAANKRGVKGINPDALMKAHFCRGRRSAQ